MKTLDIAIVSVHPDPAQPLALDLKNILAALKPYAERWIWCVRNLDWLGSEAEAFCAKVEAAGPKGLWLTFHDLLQQTGTVHQTLDGEFWAFPREFGVNHLSEDEMTLGAFPASPAELVIVAIDGGFFEVYAKAPYLLTPLRQFRDVRDENPNHYF